MHWDFSPKVRREAVGFAVAAKGAAPPAGAVGAPGGRVVSDADIDRTVGRAALWGAAKLDEFSRSEAGRTVEALGPYGGVEEVAAVKASMSALLLLGRLAKAGAVAEELTAASEIGPTVGELRAAGLKDAHHIIQDAAVRDLKGYRTNAAPGVALEGPSNLSGTAHNLATAIQRQAGGGTYAAERRIAYKALRRAGLSQDEGRAAIRRADSYFESIGVTPDTITRVPGNR